MNTVAIYRELLLPSSETFIAGQARALTRYRPLFAGLAWQPNSLISREEAVIAFRGPGTAIVRALYRRLGTFPSDFIGRVRAHHPVLVHAHFGVDGVASLPLARMLVVPHIVTFHGFDATVRDDCLAQGPFVQRRFLKQRDSLSRSGTTFLAVSAYIREQLLARGFPPERVHVHYTGIDTEQFLPAAAVAAREPHILFVARLVAKKGIHHLIQATKALQQEFPTLTVSVVGDGPEREALSIASKSLPSLRVLGYRSPQEIRELLARAKVFCVPSVTGPDGDSEGFGMVFAEAQAMGVPVVSYRSGGIPEAVEHGATGLLAPERDTHTLIRHLRTLLEMDFNAWQGFSGRAIAHVRQSFDLARQTSLLEQRYDAAREEVRGRATAII
ncbi:MAG: glycosyltransferase [Gemmatimonadales bacterium]